jgi:hypothetical protein
MSKADLHRLIDELPETEEAAARRFLEFLCDRPHEYSIEDAPFDDEPLTDEDKAALEEARASLRAGEFVTDQELWSRLGH